MEDLSSPTGDETQSVITYPVGPQIGYVSRHLTVRLERHQAEALVRLREGLIREEATLKGGHVVKTNKAALMWLLEQM